jgi:hypothetical protein
MPMFPRNSNSLPTTFLVIWTTCLSALTPTANAAAAPEERNFALDIPRLPLPEALDELKRQTDVQYLALVDLPTQPIGPLQGRFDLDAALARLLLGTGVRHERVNDHTFWLRIAPASSDDNGPSAVPAAAPDRSSRPRASDSIHEVLVTGSRVSMATSTAAPVVTYPREVIDKFGISSVGELMNHMTQQSQRVDGRYANGAQYADLRGLGLGATSVRIDGRRVVATAGDWADSFDLSLIPLAAVERVEVILEPAAVDVGARGGGIVNIILKKDFPAPSLELQYGGTNGGGGERKISLATGIDGERLDGRLVLEYYDREPSPVARAMSARSPASASPI